MSASVRRYRCYECLSPERKAIGKPGYEFEVLSTVENPACPSCGTPIKSDRGERVIHPISVIHFEAPAKAAPNSIRAKTASSAGRGGGMYLNTGSGVIACNTSRVSTGKIHTSGEPKAVTCPKCKETDVYKTMTKGTIDERFDLPVVADNDGGFRIMGLPNSGDITPEDVAEAGRQLDALRSGKGDA